MVKPGYKQTEIGIIPEDWDCTIWENVGEGFYSGATPYRAIKKYYSGDIKWVSSGELNYNVIFETIEHISDEARIKTNLKIHPANTFLMAITGLEAAGTRGSCAILGVPATTNQSCMAVYGTQRLDVKYLFYFYSKNGNELAFKFCQGTKQQSYTASIVRKLPIILPPPVEQKRIAEALSDVDDLISSLEKLIAKKKAVKQGAMQELLTGKKRLHGFTGKWNEKTLGTLCCLITKQTGFDYTNEIKQSLVGIKTNSTLPFIQNKDFNGKTVNLKTDYFVPIDVAIKYPRILLDETCMLISLSGRIGNVGLYEESKGLAFIGGAVGICRFIDARIAEWCMLFIQSVEGQKQIFESQKSGAQHNLTVEDVRKLTIKLPSDFEEQTAIVSILSDMDNEIEALEQKLAKTRQIKQGMMQQLLTGKIRLV